MLVSARRGGLVLGTSDGPQEGRGAGCWDPAKLVALQCMWPREPSVSLGSSAGGRGSPPRKFKETKSLHPSELWFSLAAWVPTHGPVPPGPPVHSCRHWALALSSSLCTVLYSTWKCWWGTQHIRGQGHQRATLPPRFPAQQLTWTAVYAMPRYAPMHTASSRSKMAGLTLKDSPWGQECRMVTPTDRGPFAPAHHSPVGIHHLLKLIVEDKLGIPAEKQPYSVLLPG